MKDKMVITCASYGGTGSSAITDLLKEFNEVKSLGEYEFSFLYDVDGVSDLQHYVVDDFHRLKTDEGIYRFLKLVYRLNYKLGYNNFLGADEFYNISKEYVDSLVDVKWQGFWLQHMERYSKVQKKLIFGFDNFKIKLYRNYLCKINKKYAEYAPSFKKSEMRLGYVSYSEFIKATQIYTSKFIDLFNIEDKYKYIALDQILPPTNLNRYMNYFENIKVIVVDRDPRDLFILNRVFWNEGWIPSDNIDTFIEWFKLLRVNNEKDNENIIRINFEDLIYKYDETIVKLTKSLGIPLNTQQYKNQYFVPERSINNTRLWEKHLGFEAEIKKIYKELKDYCYETN